MKLKLRTSLRVLLVASLFALVLPSLASAATLPTVGVSGKPGAITITGADALAPGATTFAFSGTGKNVDLLLVRLKAGKTADELVAAAARSRDATKLQRKFGDFVAGAALAKGQTSSVDVDLTAADYVLIDITRKPKNVGTFTVAGTPTGATLSNGDASITLKDFRIVASRRLPKNGAIRVHNRGPSPHFIVAFPLRPGANARDALKFLKAGKDRKFGALGGGPPISLVELLSPGVTNVLHVKLHAGTWVLACFYSDAHSRGMPHMMLGMETAVRVK